MSTRPMRLEAIANDSYQLPDAIAQARDELLADRMMALRSGEPANQSDAPTLPSKTLLCLGISRDQTFQ